LITLERWLGETLADVIDPAERKLLRSFVTWSHLRQLRQHVSDTGTSTAQAHAVRFEVTTIPANP
jgi:hypothetical protein